MSLPRIDCHRHFGGAQSVEFVWDVIQRTGAAHLAQSIDDVRAAMTFGVNEPYGFHRFLDKFRILDEIEWSEDLIDASVRDVCDGLNRDRLDFCWMRFSVNKYMAHLKWHAHEMIRFIHDSFERWAPGRVGLILSLKYESSRASQRHYAKLIERPDVAAHCMGIDLVGDEGQMDSVFYGDLLRPWRDANKAVMAHVGETQPAANVEAAVKTMHVTDVSHGIALFVGDRHLDLRDYCRDHNVAFHMALTSNRLTGAWSNQWRHPVVVALRDGQQVTIGTDDPCQCSTDFDNEFEVAASYGIAAEDVHRLRTNAAVRTHMYHNLDERRSMQATTERAKL